MISKSEIKNIPLSGNIDFRQRKIEKEHSALLIVDLQKAEYNKNNILNTGLIHQDGDFPLVGLVYLTENADIDSGTSLMLPNKNYKYNEELSEKKIILYKKSQKELSKKDLEDYKKLILDTNKNFNESIRFNNIFNRLITYTGNDFHKCNSFYTSQKERLTLVFFVKKIQTNSYSPMQRSEANLIKFSS